MRNTYGRLSILAHTKRPRKHLSAMTRFFEMIVATDLEPDAWLDATSDPLFEAFQGDVTPGTRNDIAHVGGAIDADSTLEVWEFAANVVRFLGSLGFEVVGVTVELESIPA